MVQDRLNWRGYYCIQEDFHEVSALALHLQNTVSKRVSEHKMFASFHFEYKKNPTQFLLAATLKTVLFSFLFFPSVC